MATPAPSVADIARFETKFIPVTESGCWLWLTDGARGYGSFRARGDDGVCRNWRPNRYSYAAYKGSLPEGSYVCHKCDTPSCVNPDHLYVGSQSENIADSWARTRRESASPLRKLTEAQVSRVLNGAEPGKRLAREFGVCPTVIRRIRQGRIYRYGSH